MNAHTPTRNMNKPLHNAMRIGSRWTECLSQGAGRIDYQVKDHPASGVIMERISGGNEGVLRVISGPIKSSRCTLLGTELEAKAYTVGGKNYYPVAVLPN